ncbi:ImmA/IrrE family metallo-endopeptidase [Pseudomonas sp. PDM26]|uniref:ImmA/IrrE family metallo-endopeptidase n=1 Tax=Pseudomonas sp. PDM26 TaxID=2854766 RepID=UPI001C4821AA|nr:ImmA/IrrE family metallo-endopeptidase [Pseudomonas sp. PDM26]MBV7546800.1 ImmA/IrrE family metallo-endopeptidase [Pseudomonas sp. PDM26]
MEALINPDVLRWARERASLSTSTLAKSLGTQEDNVLAWEQGKKKPSFNQAMNYARQTYIPFGYLYLSQPPVESLPLPDLRTINGKRDHGYSLALMDTIRWAMERQEWYRDYLISQGVTENRIVGRFSVSDSVAVIVADIRATLGIPNKPNRGDFDDYFKDLISKIETAGILVMRNSIVNNNTSRPLFVEEFRGFAISDKLAPVIFINTADCPEPRLFTLAHELSHIWIGRSGVSDGGPANHRAEEILCNTVAAELLTPEREFLASWEADVEWQENIPPLTKFFHVSGWVIARRALTFNLITPSEYGAFIARKIAEYKARSKNGTQPYNRLQTGRVSKTLATAVASEALSGRMLYRDAARLIGVKPHKLSDYSKKELGF